MDYAEEAAPYVLLRQGMTKEIKDRAKAAVLHAARQGKGPREISKLTGVPYSTVAYWMVRADPPIHEKTTEIYKAADTGKLRIHHRSLCEGHGCPFHHPSDHHMKTWRRVVRTDKFGAPVERNCVHGCGHPDPDSVAYIKTLLPSDEEAWGLLVHGCCHLNCCANPKEES